MSLKTDLRRQILEDMIKQAVAASSGPGVVLVVDPHATRVLSSCVRMYDVMEAGVLVLENITVERERVSMPALYFVEPTRDSVARVVADFEGDKPQYSEAHIYFTSHCPPEVEDMIVASERLVQHLRMITSVNCDFVAAESRLFLLDRPRALRSLLGLRAQNPDDHLERELRRTARQLSSLCLTLHEYPYIRYQEGCRNAERLAGMFERDLNERIAQLPRWVATPGRDRGTLLIVDRSLDPVAPLMHELTYQAMAQDTLRSRGENMYVPADGDEKKAAAVSEKAVADGGDDKFAGYTNFVMSEDDADWVRYRHQHIANVQASVSRSFAEFRKQNAMAKLRGKDDRSEASLKEMISAMKSLPQYQSIIRSMEKHMSVALACMSQFDAQHLATLAELEQDIVTGVDENGDKVRQSALRERLAVACTDRAISTVNKMRLLMVYLAVQGDLGSSRRQLLDSAGIGPDLARAMTNLRYLGVDLAASRRAADPRREAEFAERARSAQLQFMRFVPRLHGVLRALAADTLSREAYPYTKEPPPKPEVSASVPSASALGGGGAGGAGVASVRRNNRRNDWRDKKKGGGAGAENSATAEASESKVADDTAEIGGPHLITFVLGGISYSEVRSAYEVAAERHANLTVGSTEGLTAASFMEAMQGDDEDDDDLSDADDEQIGIRIDRLK